jgi:hypothetical protein
MAGHGKQTTCNSQGMGQQTCVPQRTEYSHVLQEAKNKTTRLVTILEGQRWRCSQGDIHETQEKFKATFRHLCQKVAYEVNSLLGRLLGTIGERQFFKKCFVA